MASLSLLLLGTKLPIHLSSSRKISFRHASLGRPNPILRVASNRVAPIASRSFNCCRCTPGAGGGGSQNDDDSGGFALGGKKEKGIESTDDDVSFKNDDHHEPDELGAGGGLQKVDSGGFPLIREKEEKAGIESTDDDVSFKNDDHHEPDELEAGGCFLNDGSGGFPPRGKEIDDLSFKNDHEASNELGTSMDSSVPLIPPSRKVGNLGKIYRGFVLSNQLEFQQHLRSIHIDLEESIHVDMEEPKRKDAEFHETLTESEAKYSDFVIGVVRYLKGLAGGLVVGLGLLYTNSWVFISQHSFIRFIVAFVVAPSVVIALLIAFQLKVHHWIFLTIKSIMKGLGVEDWVGDVVVILKNVLLKFAIKSSWGKKIWPKPPKRPKIDSVIPTPIHDVVFDKKKEDGEPGESDESEDDSDSGDGKKKIKKEDVMYSTDDEEGQLTW